jgi:hypothetical protein
MTAAKTNTLQDQEIVRLIKTTDLTCEAIGKKYGISSSAVTRRGTKAGVNMKMRAVNTGAHKKRRTRAREVMSHVPDSMTGDGYSLEWLSKEWKLCTA